MDISAHLLGPMKATQQTWRARFSSAIFLSEFQYSFYFFHNFVFLLFHVLDFTQLLCFTEPLLAFKMGVKNVRHFMIV